MTDHLKVSLFHVTYPIGRREELNSAIDEYTKVGPLGSTDRKIPICLEKLHSKLHDETSSLAHLWTEAQISDWISTLAPNNEDMNFIVLGICVGCIVRVIFS